MAVRIMLASFIFTLVVLLLVMQVDGARKKGKLTIRRAQTQHSHAKGARHTIRKQVVKCCGAKSCFSERSSTKSSNWKKLNATTISDEEIDETNEEAGGQESSTENGEAPTSDTNEASSVESAATEAPVDGAVTPIDEQSSPSSEEGSTEGETTAELAESSSMASSSTNGGSSGSSTSLSGASSQSVPGIGMTTGWTTTVSTSTTSATTTITAVSTTTPKTITTAAASTTAKLNGNVIYTCPSSCTKNSTLFTNGQLKDPRDFGFWVESCGQLFLFGKSIVDWEANLNRCCSLGMQPIMLESDEKRNCFNNLTKDWIFNSNYWTAGRKVTDLNEYNWCTTSQVFTKNTNMWATGYPNTTLTANEGCVHLRIVKNSKVETTERNCTDKYVFGCQGAPTPPPSCSAPACPDLMCTKNVSYFTTLADKTTMILTNPQLHGTWHSINGRIYMFSFGSTTWQAARQECCSIGMKLLSVDFDYEFDNLFQALKGVSIHNVTTQVGEFWSSGADIGCESNYGWCAVNKLVRNAKWAWQQPSDRNGLENCISVKIDRIAPLFSDNNCENKMRYICESRDTTKSTGSSEAIVDECGQVFNVTRQEAEDVLNMTSNFTSKIKCYLRCLAEQSGYMINGKIVDENLLAMAELLAAKAPPTKLQENLQAVDSCSSIKGMDECDTAAFVYQCGQDKAPNLVSDIIASVEMNSSAETVPLQGDVSRCPADFPCQIDDLSKLEYENNSLNTTSGSAGGTFFTACGLRYIAFLSQRQYVANMDFDC
ncbi:uncharacterized protein LOC132203244 isoform X2 [Neocloeon triangulifer]|uniref:uncharacterized protein LOC132203244 isoform X2 n=1 Tax=Neocloeon triangulifer TaxID=2078957 RepID=UPI00286EF858|nr:uncharacterized protein LOC132203244 isoform X2 [Neocloeon triangulifer]